MDTVLFQKLDPDAKVPTYANPGDAGADLYSIEDRLIRPEEIIIVKTGLAIAVPEGHVGLVHPRSGMAAKYGITVLNAPGTIDSGYRGEIKVILVNHSRSLHEIRKGDRIAQIVFQEYKKADFIEVKAQNTTLRGFGGFGSTGN